jgi:small subunit ribosomal protein S24e
MEVKIDSTTDNKLLERKEIEATVRFTGATPPRKEIKEGICGKLGANPDLVVLRSVAGEFGMKRLRISAHAYSDANTLKKNEPRHILKREGMIVETEEEKKKAAEEKAKKKAAPKKK